MRLCRMVTTIYLHTSHPGLIHQIRPKTPADPFSLRQSQADSLVPWTQYEALSKTCELVVSWPVNVAQHSHYLLTV